MKTATKAATKTAGKSVVKSRSSQNGSNNTAPRKKLSEEHHTAFMEMFEDELKDIYWAEKALTKALPRMIKKAESADLIAAIEEHLEVTQSQITRVEDVFEMIGKTAKGKKCESMAGMIKEAEEVMSELEKGAVRDAAIIACAQKVEHYEIATYGTLRTFAKMMGLEDVAGVLQSILDEEKEADVKLTEIAMASVNEEAIAE